MANDVEAGRLVVTVVGDTSRFSAGLQKRLDAATARIEARIQATVDRTGFRKSLTEAVQAAVRGQKIKVPITVDRAGFRAAVTEAIQAAARGQKIRVEASVDTARMRRELAAASRGGQARVNVDADTGGAEARVAAFRRQAESRALKIKVDVDTRSLSRAGSAVASLLKFPLAAAGISLAAGALTSVAAGLGAVVAAAAPAVGVLGAIPGLVTVAAQGIGTLAAGFSGVGEAVKAMGQQQTGAAKTASTTAAAQEAAAERVRAAQERLAEARRRVGEVEEQVARRVGEARRGVEDAARRLGEVEEQAARSIEEAQRRVGDAVQRVAEVRAQAARRVEAAARSVVEAERRVAEAQRDSQRAQEDLNRARADATERLEDLNRALRHSSLDEEDALLAIEEARQRLRETNADPGSSDLERRSADLALRQAIANLEDVRDRNQDLQKETAEANRNGVEGATEVVAARENIADAHQRELDAMRELADAQRNLRDVQVDASRDIAQAQRSVADAQRDLADAQRDAARDIADAQRGVADAAQNLRDAQVDGARDIADAQRGVVDAQRGVEQAMRKSGDAAEATGAAQDKLATAMNNLSPAGQRFARFLFDRILPGLKRLKFAAQEAILPGVQRGLDKAMVLLPIFERALTRTGGVLGSLTERFADLITTPEFQRDLATIFETNAEALDVFGQAGLNVFSAIRHLVVASGPLILRFAGWIEDITDRLDAFLGRRRASGQLEKDFQTAGDVAAQLGRILGNIARILLNVGKAAAPAGQILLDSFERATASLAKLTGSVEGQNAMKKYFLDAVPAVQETGRLLAEIFMGFVRLGDNPATADLIRQLREELVPVVFRILEKLQELGPSLVDLFTNIAKLVEKLVGGGAGGLEGFVATLNTLVTGLNRLLEIPGAAPVVTMLLALAGTGAALGLVAAGVLRIVGGLSKLAKLSGASKVLGSLAQAGAATRGAHRAPGGILSRITEPVGNVVRGVGAAAGAVGRGAVRAGGAVGGAVARAGGAIAARGRAAGPGDRGSAAVGTLTGGSIGEAVAAAAAKARAALAAASTAVANFAKASAAAAVGGVKSLAAAITGASRAAAGAALSIARTGAAAVAAAGRWAVMTAATIANRVALVAVAAATRAFTAVQLVLTAVMALNPFVLVIAAIGLLVAAFVCAWRNSEQFRKIVTAAWNGIKAAAIAVFNAVAAYLTGWWADAKALFSAGLNAVTAVWNASWAAARAVISAVFNAVRSYLSGWWADAKALFSAGLKAVSAVWNTYWATVRVAVSIVFNAIKALASSFWTAVKTMFSANLKILSGAWSASWAAIRIALLTVFTVIRTAASVFWTALRGVFSAALKALQGNWSGAWAAIRNTAASIMATVRQNFASVLGAIRTAFSTAVTGIRKIWDGLRAATRAPVAFVIDTVYNKGIAAVWNRIAGVAGLPKLNVLQFSRGGVAPGYAPGQDSLIAAVSPGEGILVPEAVRGLAEAAGTTGSRVIDGINSAFSNRVQAPGGGPASPMDGLLPGFASGGIVDRIKNAAGATKSTVANVLGGAKDLLIGGLEKVASAAIKPIRSAINSVLRGNLFADALRNMSNKALDGILKRIKGVDATGGGPVNPGLAGALAWAKAQAGKPYGWGASGPNSFDCSGFMSAIINHIKGARNRWQRLFATGSMPAGGLVEGLRSAFMVGWSRNYANSGIGHTAGTLNGVNVESRGGRGVVIGSAARGWRDRGFNRWAGLKGYSRGGLVGDPPYDTLTPKGRDYLGIDIRELLAEAAPLASGAVVQPRAGGTLAMLAEAGRAEAVVDEGLLNRRLAEMDALRDLVKLIKTGSLGVHIEDGAIRQEIHNPAPETPSQTLNVRMKALAAGGLFGAVPSR